MNGLRVGFSDKVNDTTIQASLKKNKKITIIFAIVMVLLPVIITAVMSMNSEKSTLPVGIGVSIIFLICFIVPAIKKKCRKEWEGVVVDKEIVKKNRRKKDGDYIEETIYLIKVCKSNGKNTNIKETEIYHPYYDYLNIEDKIKYYPQFNHYYEKYDKTNDTYLYCAVCQTKNDINEEYCTKCGAVILK